MHSWTYDGIGNRTSAAVNGTPTSYTYFTNPSNPLNGQRLQSDGVSAYTYDANGNTLTRTGTPGSFTFGWDAQDRLTSIAGSATATYTYDYQGRRTGTTVGGSTTTYLYDGLNVVRTSGASQAEYLFGPGIDEPLAMRRGGTVYHYSVDGLGSVALVTNQGGTTVHDAYLYDAWGVLRRQTGTVANDFGYTAREFAEAGLWFYRARYHQPGIGRFESEDPKPRMDRTRLYAYVANSPIQGVDPTGRVCGIQVWQQHRRPTKGQWGHWLITWPEGGGADFYPARGGSWGYAVDKKMGRVVRCPQCPGGAPPAGMVDSEIVETEFSDDRLNECPAVCKALYKCLTEFAKKYTKDWCFYSNNCHDFAKDALGGCGLRISED